VAVSTGSSLSRVEARPFRAGRNPGSAADPAKCCFSKLNKDPGPETRCTPSSEAGVDRTPRPKTTRKVSPRNTGAKHIPHRHDHTPVIIPRTPSFVARGHLPFFRTIRSIFLPLPERLGQLHPIFYQDGLPSTHHWVIDSGRLESAVSCAIVLRLIERP
jgi:hypothetical protein